MSGPNKGNREFCFPETLNVFRGEAGENIEVKGKQDWLFPAEPVIKCFVIPPNWKLDETAKTSFNLAHTGWHYLITYESKADVFVSLGS